MKKSDLALMCLKNLLRRKARTMLTVLGVLIGCCAIVIMVSLGVGMKESQDIMLAQMGDLTVITVYPGNQTNGSKLNGEMVKAFRKLDGVDAATPKITCDNLTFTLYAGKEKRYVTQYTMVAAMDRDAMEKLGYQLTEGSFLPKGKSFTALAGQYFAYAFADSKRPMGYNTVDYSSMYQPDGTVTDPPDPFFQPLSTPLVMEIQLGTTGKTLTQSITCVGLMKEDYGKGPETSQGLLLDIDDLQKLINQATHASGLKVNNDSYQSVLVKTRGIEKVSDVEEKIKKMGFSTSSMESVRKPMEKEAQQKQMMLGGLGAISLFVAALGITNTMIMSISERTREIGVMKSLGCFVRDIRTVFLMEAGCIGFIGGVAGTAISYLISIAMNLITAKAAIKSFADISTVLSTPGSRISVIPGWLAVFAVLFSILIGLGSGYYPANKAVKISALEAIKHD